jgi:hypothetical protein
MVASLRDSGATAEVVRDTDEGGFAWAELGDLAASVDYMFNDETGSWVAHVTAAHTSDQILERKPSADVLHSIVLKLLQTETTTT